jgi:hypothetical protein
VSDLNSDLNFLNSNKNTKGIIAKKPIKNLTALKVNGPISSIPVSCAINVVPQIKVQSTNNMPEVCGRICPQDRLCEGNCVFF